MANLTPMMQQYLDVKEQYSDCILFFRLGDFYEMFFSDAETASRELEITLTGRDCGLAERAPMCGVPFHSADTYITRLINKGFKVAICEQVEDPNEAKGIVRREVIKVVTPGTVTESSMLDDKKNNYLMSIYRFNTYHFGIASVDISTGEFFSTSINWGNTIGKLMDEIARFLPAEIVVNRETYEDENLTKEIKQRFNTYITHFDEEYFGSGFSEDRINSHFGDKKDFEFEGNIDINASGALLEYLYRTQKAGLPHIRTINRYRIEDYMVLDVTARRNLEISETMRDKSKKGTLLWVLDRTMTSMGARTLRRWVDQPLINKSDIDFRLDAVEELKSRFMMRMELRELLKKVYDMERLLSRVILQNANGRDLTALKVSIGQIPNIKGILSDAKSGHLFNNFNELDTLDDVYELIEASIIDEPPVSVKDGGIIKTGYNEDVDRLRNASVEGKTWIAQIEAQEREKTGIRNLKVGFNKVFGYFIEVTKSNINNVPDYFIRKQTLANCERYITDELKKIEDTVLGAEEKVIDLEYSLFVDIRNKIAENVGRIKSTAASLAEIDVLCSLSEVADREDYIKPLVNEDGKIDIKEGRHPVVEKMMDKSLFVPNDTYLDFDEDRLSIITGPNMAGKSTYMRQVAIIVLMSQMGSFVPAKSAEIGIVDRIFTRVGASDDLSSGQSTFMVEMSEVANILNNATSRSLLILDEIGRGTSTFDGLSIAWAVIEHISDRVKMGCRALFATHYHELTELEGKIKGIKNYCISVKEQGEDIIFLRKIIRGGADESYGIHVARLAGVPKAVVTRAKDILTELEDADISKKELRFKRNKAPVEGQIDIFSYQVPKWMEEVISEIKETDIQTLTPIDALNVIYKLQQKIRKGN